MSRRHLSASGPALSEGPPIGDAHARISLLSFVALTYAYSWTIWLIAGLADGQPLIVWLGAWGPNLAAIVMSYRAGGRAGVSRLVDGFSLTKVRVPTVVAAVVVPFVLLLVGVAMDAIWADTALSVRSAMPLHLLPLHLVFGVLIGPLQEELGWRGVALRQLLERTSPARASLLVGVVWALWHLPLFAIEDRSLPLAPFLIGVTASSFLYTQFFRRSRGSLVIVIVLHAAFNTAVITFLQRPADQGETGPYLAATALTVVAAAGLTMWWRFRERAEPPKPPARR